MQGTGAGVQNKKKGKSSSGQVVVPQTVLEKPASTGR